MRPPITLAGKNKRCMTETRDRSHWPTRRSMAAAPRSTKSPHGENGNTFSPFIVISATYTGPGNKARIYIGRSSLSTLVSKIPDTDRPRLQAVSTATKMIYVSLETSGQLMYKASASDQDGLSGKHQRPIPYILTQKVPVQDNRKGSKWTS